jgi:hypothetical protein
VIGHGHVFFLISSGNKNNNSPKASNTPKTQKQPDPDKLKKHELARQAKNYQKMNEKNVVKEIESDPLVRVIKAKSAYPYGSGGESFFYFAFQKCTFLLNFHDKMFKFLICFLK